MVYFILFLYSPLPFMYNLLVEFHLYVLRYWSRTFFSCWCLVRSDETDLLVPFNFLTIWNIIYLVNCETNSILSGLLSGLPRGWYLVISCRLIFISRGPLIFGHKCRVVNSSSCVSSPKSTILCFSLLSQDISSRLASYYFPLSTPDRVIPRWLLVSGER